MFLKPETLNPAIADDAPQSVDQAAIQCETLLARLKDRDPDAFDEMVMQKAPELQRLVSQLLGWDSACEDVVQEVFVTAWEKIDRFRGDSSINTWLYSIAINQCRKVRRKRGRWRKTFQRLCERQLANTQVIDLEQKTDPTVAAIHKAVNELNQRDREVIVLCSLEGKTIDEAGTLLGIRKNTLEVRLHRARKRLKQLLKTSIEDQQKS